MAEITAGEVSPAQFEQLNAMCVPSGPAAQAAHSAIQSAIKESAEALRQASVLGLRAFGAFMDSEPVGRLEVSPIEATPVPLTTTVTVPSTATLTVSSTTPLTVPSTVPLTVPPTRGDVWVIRCFWVLEKAEGMGLGRRLMELAFHAVGNQPIAVLTYEDWMPPAFLEKFGFRQVQRTGEGILMVRAGGAGTGEVSPEGSVPRATPTPDSTPICFTPVRPTFDVRTDCVRVDAVYTPRCPWRIVNVRRRLAEARELSDRVVTHEYPLVSHEDALRLGEEYIYVDGEPLSGGPVTKEALLRVVKERLTAKGL